MSLRRTWWISTCLTAAGILHLVLLSIVFRCRAENGFVTDEATFGKDWDTPWWYLIWVVVGVVAIVGLFGWLVSRRFRDIAAFIAVLALTLFSVLTVRSYSRQMNLVAEYRSAKTKPSRALETLWSHGGVRFSYWVQEWQSLGDPDTFVVRYRSNSHHADLYPIDGSGELRVGWPTYEYHLGFGIAYTLRTDSFGGEHYWEYEVVVSGWMIAAIPASYLLAWALIRRKQRMRGFEVDVPSTAQD